MTPTTEHHDPLTTDRGPLRVRLDNGFPSGPLDGAWWPRSRDLKTEVRDIVDHFPHFTSEVVRVLFTRPDWDGQTPTHSEHKVLCARGLVNIGSFPHDDSHRVVLVMRSGERLTLLVIPPDIDVDVARDLMDRASDDLNVVSGTELLARAGAHPSTLRLHVWEDEGGAPDPRT
ncbi:DUF5994 family protein [Nocardioides yefusunii]|uniref:DUF5994 family protein n=1 Tax=Nocardioides yefusunii TaxID=2500546 RepID=A0ABW1QWM7_9ACTN|nr:DUF5994 family protein [Nocardioides yefusunii]